MDPSDKHVRANSVARVASHPTVCPLSHVYFTVPWKRTSSLDFNRIHKTNNQTCASARLTCAATRSKPAQEHTMRVSDDPRFQCAPTRTGSGASCIHGRLGPVTDRFRYLTESGYLGSRYTADSPASFTVQRTERAPSEQPRRTAHHVGESATREKHKRAPTNPTAQRSARHKAPWGPK